MSEKEARSRVHSFSEYLSSYKHVVERYIHEGTNYGGARATNVPRDMPYEQDKQAKASIAYIAPAEAEKTK